MYKHNIVIDIRSRTLIFCYKKTKRTNCVTKIYVNFNKQSALNESGHWLSKVKLIDSIFYEFLNKIALHYIILHYAILNFSETKESCAASVSASHTYTHIVKVRANSNSSHMQ